MTKTWIRNATIYDGTGTRPFVSSVLLEGNRIVDMGAALHAGDADAVVDGEGLALAPGFINTHSHMELEMIKRPTLDASVMQGITTEVLGQDGFSVAPCTDETLGMVTDSMAPLAGTLNTPYPWRSFESFLKTVDELKPPVKFVSLVGHATLRINVMGNVPRKATAVELSKMCELLEISMRQGAKGMSMGLIYPPGSYGDVDEISELAKVVARFDGIIMVHMRNEKDRLLTSIDEMLTVVRRSGVRLQISHFKALGNANWGSVREGLRRVEEASRAGFEVTFDQYPWDAASTGLKVCLPAWSYNDGLAAYRDFLKDPEARKRVLAETDAEIQSRGGGHAIMISSTETPEYAWMSGKRVDEIGEKLGLPAAETVLQILAHEGLAVVATYFSISEDDVQYVMQSPLQCVCTDGIVGAHPHPRMYGTFPRYLGHYVRELQLIPLEEAVRKITSEPARRLRLWDRGLIRTGMAADLVLFDPARIEEGSTYLAPTLPPKGILGVWMDGKRVHDGTDSRA